MLCYAEPMTLGNIDIEYKALIITLEEGSTSRAALRTLGFLRKVSSSGIAHWVIKKRIPEGSFQRFLSQVKDDLEPQLGIKLYPSREVRYRWDVETREIFHHSLNNE
jgi:hypothetical protein